ncbi:MAG: response regulator [Candidatus Omnitrophota bacterium]|jgi:CheY-like chemotaxis protein/anti-sigma regulatory factor (Ser/Thr protein kinase)|nr:MAG: response regulator [Candidatus Omnitrophota bacterium]
MSEGTILVVDDELMIRELLVEILTNAGDYHILTADNGKKALNICNDYEVDLVFTDLRMPEMNGMELLAELRRDKPEIPVVILTGFGRREDAIEALRLGASNFLLKPQEVDQVHSIASKILRMRMKKRMKQRIFDFFVEERQTYYIPSEIQFTLPLIDLLTEKVECVGICNQSELMNIRLALDEAMVNAVIHGNLEITSQSKGTTLDELVAFNQLVKERSKKEPFMHRKVKVSTQLSQDHALFTIEDEGKGFDWKMIPESFEDVEILANHGRGLILIRAFMSRVDFNEKGNKITMIKLKGDQTEAHF